MTDQPRDPADQAPAAYTPTEDGPQPFRPYLLVEDEAYALFTPRRRRLLRNAAGPTFQGDGWRWTLSLLLPNLLLWRCRGYWAPAGAPFTLDLLVLNRAQRLACYDEWHLTQLALEAEAEGLPPRSQDDELFLLPSRLYAVAPLRCIGVHLRRVLLALAIAAGIALLVWAFVGTHRAATAPTVSPAPVTTGYTPTPAGSPVPAWPVGCRASTTP